MVATSGLLALLLGACASTPSPSPSTDASSPPAAATSTGGPLVAGSSPDANSSDPIDDVLDVVCLPSGTSIATPRVAAQANGVHVHIVNASGTRRIGFEVHGFGGGSVPRVKGTRVWDVPPGVVGVRCLPFDQDDSPWVVVEVRDPSGFFVPDRITCAGVVAGGSFDGVAGARGEDGEPVDLTRHRYAAISAGDVVERAGYRRPDERKIRVVRDGVVEIVDTYESDGAGGWRLRGSSVCQDDMQP